MIRRIPKVGFTSRFRKEFALLNLNQIERSGESKLDLKKIIELRLISRLKDGLKILGEGDLKRAVHIEAHAFSQSAKEKIEKAAGKAVLIEVKAKNKVQSTSSNGG